MRSRAGSLIRRKGGYTWTLPTIWGMGGFLAFVPLYALDLGMGGASLVLGLSAGLVVLIRSVGATIPYRIGPGRAVRISLVLTSLGLALIGLWRTRRVS